MSSAWHTTPPRPLSIVDMQRLKCSGAEVMPKGRRLKQNLQKGVINVVNSDNLESNGICQNPEFPSSFVKT